MCQVIWPFSFTINSIRVESGHLIGCSALQWGQKGPSPLQRISSSASLLNIWAYTPYDNVSRVSHCHPTLTPPQHNQQVTMPALYFYVNCQGTFINYVGLMFENNCICELNPLTREKWFCQTSSGSLIVRAWQSWAGANLSWLSWVSLGALPSEDLLIMHTEQVSF